MHMGGEQSVSATLIAYKFKTINYFFFVAARFPIAFRIRHALKSKERREEPAVDQETSLKRKKKPTKNLITIYRCSLGDISIHPSFWLRRFGTKLQWITVERHHLTRSFQTILPPTYKTKVINVIQWFRRQSSTHFSECTWVITKTDADYPKIAGLRYFIWPWNILEQM